MGKTSKLLSVGGIVETPVRFLNPKEYFKTFFFNAYKTARLGGLIITGFEKKPHRGEEKLVLTVRHEEHSTQNIWVLAHNVRLIQAGMPPFFHVDDDADDGEARVIIRRDVW